MKRILVIALTVVLVFAFASCNLLGIFSKSHTVTLDLNGGVANGFETSITVSDGESVGERPTPIYEGYLFLGWFNGEELFTAETVVTEDITLVAKWVLDNKYTITYDCGDVADSFTVSALKGELPKIPSAPTADGYVFFGWYTDAELTERYFFDYNLDTDTTLYAKFYDTSLGEYTVISNFDQLVAIKEAPDAKYLLACDINCKGEELAIIDEFTGELDGNGYKIFNFALSVDESNVAFVRTNNGTVKNLSFASFVFDVYVGMVDNHYYAVVCGINNGTVENCHTLDGEIVVSDSISGGYSAVFVGALVGYNKTGVINDCSNNTILNITLDKTNNVYNGNIESYAGGICGWNNTEATVTNVINYANVTMHVISRGGAIYSELGGIVGGNKGSVKQSANFGDVSVDTEDAGNFVVSIYAAGAVASNNNGKIENCYAQCSVSVENAANRRNLNLIGGFVARNNGKIYNCYSVVDIKDTTAQSIAIGGFVAYHELVQGNDSYINKCFALGSIEITGASTNIGELVGYSTANIKDSYYADSFTINKKVVTEDENGEITESLETVEATAAFGSSKSESELLTLEFIADVLYFDREIWLVYDGQLPTLR